jgi:hypothetical protein
MYPKTFADEEAKDPTAKLAKLISASEDLRKAQHPAWHTEPENSIHCRAEQYFSVPKNKIIDLGIVSEMAYIDEARTEFLGDRLKRSPKKVKADEFCRRLDSPEERRLEKMRETLFANCEVFSLNLDTSTKEKILQESNPETLLHWIRHSVSARTTDDIFSS